MVDDEPSLYRRLGVTPAATTSEIRDAYRRLAVRFHPDHLLDAAATDRKLAERRMREINEAWAVLRDPDRRLAYDRSRAGSTGRSRDRRAARTSAEAVRKRSAPVEPEPDLDIDQPVPGRLHLARHLPWLALIIVLALIVVFTAYADRDPGPGDDRTPSRPEVGSCVDIAPGPTAVVVPCDGPHEFRVVARVSDPSTCPGGSEGRRLDPDGRFDCLESA